MLQRDLLWFGTPQETEMGRSTQRHYINLTYTAREGKGTSNKCSHIEMAPPCSGHSCPWEWSVWPWVPWQRVWAVGPGIPTGWTGAANCREQGKHFEWRAPKAEPRTSFQGWAAQGAGTPQIPRSLWPMCWQKTFRILWFGHFNTVCDTAAGDNRDPRSWGLPTYIITPLIMMPLVIHLTKLHLFHCSTHLSGSRKLLGNLCHSLPTQTLTGLPSGTVWMLGSVAILWNSGYRSRGPW